MQFKEVINFVSVPELKKRVEKFPDRGKIPSRKAEMTSLAFKLSTSSEALLEYWGTLDEDEKRALQESVHTHEGKIYEAFYSAKYKTKHPKLTRHGYYTTASDDSKLLTCFYPSRRNGLPNAIPDEILASLKRVIPKPEDYTVETVDTLPTAAKCDTLKNTERTKITEYLTSQQSEAELHALLNLIKQRAIKVSEKTGSELNELQAFITERDPQPFLPDEVERLFKNLHQNKRAVVAEGKVLLLTCTSKNVAKHIAHVPELKSWCKRVGDTQLIIPVNKENLFRKTVHQLHNAMPVSKA